jgi:hypothetical protein
MRSVAGAKLCSLRQAYLISRQAIRNSRIGKNEQTRLRWPAEPLSKRTIFILK